MKHRLLVTFPRCREVSNLAAIASLGADVSGVRGAKNSLSHPSRPFSRFLFFTLKERKVHGSNKIVFENG